MSMLHRHFIWEAEIKYDRFQIVVFPKVPWCKLILQTKWPHETSITNEAYIVTLGLPLNGSSFGILEKKCVLSRV